MKPLTLKDIEKYDAAKEIAKDIEDGILLRIEYVYKTIAKAFGSEVISINLYDSNEELRISADDVDSDNEFEQFLVTFKDRNKALYGKSILLKDGDEWFFDNCTFPTKWIFEDFEEELNIGVKKFQAQQKLNALILKEEEKIKKNTESAAIEVAKNKLSKEELQLLNIK